MDESTPQSYPQENKLPSFPNDTLAYILTFLPIGEQISLETLLACQLVSRNFSLASKQEQVWRPWLLGCWSTPFVLGYDCLSRGYCDPADQETLTSILGWAGGPLPSSFQLFGKRTRFDSFVKLQLEKLVSSPHDRLKPFTILSQLDLPLVDALKTALRDLNADPAERLTREFWAAEVESGMLRRTAARMWRKMDYGELEDGDVIGTKALEELALMFCSAFSVRGVEDSFQLIEWLETIARDATIFLAPFAQAIAEQHPEGHHQHTHEKEEIRSTVSIIKKLHHLLFCYGLQTGPLDASSSLDLSFPSIVKEYAQERNTDVDFSFFMRLETLGTAVEQETPLGILRPMLRDRSPSISWTLYSAVFCAVASRLQLGLAVKCSPILRRKTLIKIETSEREEGTLLFDLGDEKYDLVRDKRVESLPPTLDGCSLLHQIAGDITSSLNSQKTSERPRVPLEYALYAALLIPSVISRPYQGPEAVLRLSSAASKLAPHLACYFPLDLIILEELILPLVGTESARKLIEEEIQKVKKADQGTEPTHRPKGAKFKLGEIAKSTEGWVGVVCGYGRFDEEMYKSTEPANSIELPERIDQLFYWILSADLPSPHFSYTHYAAEDSLSSIDRATQKDEMTKLLRVPGLGRWFGGVQAVAEGGAYRFVLSKEAISRFPDDVNLAGELVDM